MEPEVIYVEDDQGRQHRARLCWGGPRPESRLYKIDNGPLLMMWRDGTLFDDRWRQYRQVPPR